MKEVIPLSWLVISIAFCISSASAHPRTSGKNMAAIASALTRRIARSSCQLRGRHEPVFPGRGEVRLDGTVISVDAAGTRLEMKVSFVTLADGTTAQLEPYRRKTVLLSDRTGYFGSADDYPARPDFSLLKKGDRVSVIGKDLGVGHSIPARLLAAAPAVITWEGSPAELEAPAPRIAGRLPMIWICGDSLSEEPGKLLVKMIEHSGAAHAALEYKVSSGLSVPTFYDWPEHFQRGMARWNPDLVVVILGANDRQDFEVGGESLSFGTRGWQTEYGRRIGSAMETLAGRKGRVIWLSVPVMRSARFTHHLAVMNKLIWEEAAIHRGATYLDSSPVFASRSGAFLNTTPGGERLRASDGIHFARAGAIRLARFLFNHIK